MKRLKSGVAQQPGGVLLCAVEECVGVALVGDCLCDDHCRTRDARTQAMREIAVERGFAPKKTTGDA